MKVSLILRRSERRFFSIEKVFSVLQPYLGGTFISLPYRSSSVLNRLRNIFFLLNFKKQIIHISGHDHYLLWYPFKNTILTIHDIEALRRKKGFKKWLFKKLWFDIPIKNAKMVTTISEFTKKELMTLNAYKTPIYVVPNPLTIELNYEPKVEWSDTLKILHIGTKRNKNLTRTIGAIKGLDCELTIIGQLDEEQKRCLVESGIQYRNRFELSDQEVIEEYHKCELLCFISTYEGFGLPIVEAQALGRVVLTSNLASMPEVAGSGAYFVNPFQLDEIRNAILELKSNQELRKSLLGKGIANVKRFKAERVAQLYQQLYDKVDQ
ncbi:MAG: glycosyltransferase family 1 protein [Vicingaceae bacterium]